MRCRIPVHPAGFVVVTTLGLSSEAYYAFLTEHLPFSSSSEDREGLVMLVLHGYTPFSCL